jgi:hypothetical protein
MMRKRQRCPRRRACPGACRAPRRDDHEATIFAFEAALEREEQNTLLEQRILKIASDLREKSCRTGRVMNKEETDGLLE